MFEIEGVEKAMTWSLRQALGPATSGHSTRRALRRLLPHHHAQLASNSRATMVEKTYKELKEAWVTGHTGSSVADVNSVSLAMPVPHTLLKIVTKPQLTKH